MRMIIACILAVFVALANADINNPSVTQVGALSTNGGVMGGVLDMGGYSITNIGTNSLTFSDGTKVSVLSNGVLGVSVGGTNSPKTIVDSGNIAAAGGLTNIAVFHTPATLYSAPTVTVTKAQIDAWPMGEASMTLTSTVSLLNFSGLGTNDAGTWVIGIIGTNGYTLDTNNLYGASTAVAAATNSATLPNEYVFRKVSGDIKPFVRITSQ